MTEKLYYRDSYLREFEGQVLERTRLKGRTAVVLDRTAFYPTSGGQPNDTGTLGAARVVDVVDVDGRVVQVLEGEAPSVGETVRGEIDWPRRLDHMQQHTGQHILSQAFERAASARTVSFHLGDEACTIDVDQTPLDAEAIARAERLANEVVLEDREVLVHLVAPDDLERFALRKPTERSGEIRVIEVARFDASACGGTHTARTGQVGPIKVRRWERRSGATRVEFVCGWRALADYGWKHDLVRSLSEGFRVRDRDVGEAVARLQADLKGAREALDDARAQLQEGEIAEYLDEATPLQTGDGLVRLVVEIVGERTPDELKRLAQRLTAEGQVVALLGATTGERASLAFGKSPSLPFDSNALLRVALKRLSGRGGGTKDLAQGGAPTHDGLEEALWEAARVLTDETEEQGER
jgi:alanyl-tRNA synthetase